MSILKAFIFSKPKRKKRNGLDLAWGHRRGKRKKTLLAKAFGVNKKSKRATNLDSAWSRRRYTKASFTGTIANRIGGKSGKGKYAPGNIMSIVTGQARGKKEKKTKVSKGMLGFLGAVGYGLSRDDRLSPAELATLAQTEARQTITDGNAKEEAVRNQDTLQQIADWIRARFRRADG